MHLLLLLLTARCNSENASKIGLRINTTPWNAKICGGWDMVYVFKTKLFEIKKLHHKIIKVCGRKVFACKLAGVRSLQIFSRNTSPSIICVTSQANCFCSNCFFFEIGKVWRDFAIESPKSVLLGYLQNFSAKHDFFEVGKDATRCLKVEMAKNVLTFTNFGDFRTVLHESPQS